MKKIDKNYFGTIGMALSCTLFLAGALKKYKNYVMPVDVDMIRTIDEWNKVLISLLQDKKYKSQLGDLGNKLVAYSSRCKDFSVRCVEDAPDASVQGLHYVLRFQENVKYLNSKYNADLCFCDFGCGLSPLAVVFQQKYNLQDVYCVDIVPEIADLYTDAAYKLTGKIPSFIDWAEVQKLSGKKINTITSIGCLPHMSKEVQKEYMKIINKKFHNFFLEIKYKKSDNVPNADNAFTLRELQELRVDVENVTDIETAMIRICLNYIRKFVRAKPDRRDFLINQSRCLFLSR